jgi:hypothetical protein
MNLLIRWKNFRSLHDTGWCTLKPLTIVLGPNNSGKTSFVSPLLLLQQTLDASNESTALLTKGPLLDFGLFTDMVRNHDPDAQVEFSFRWRPIKSSKDPKKPVGQEAPSTGIFLFERGDQETIRLAKLTVLDVCGRAILERKRKANGQYSLTKLPEIKAPSKASSLDQVLKKRLAIHKAIQDASPERFFFSGSTPFLHAVFDNTESKEDKPGQLIPEPDAYMQRYVAVLSELEFRLNRLLRSITYLGPLRERARRHYVLSGEEPRNVGVRGEYAPEILFRNRDNADKMATIHNWLEKFGFSDKLVLQPQGPGAFSLSWATSTEHASDTAFVDMGFGLSQVLPLIVQGVIAEAGSTIIAEQPEIHLNPRLQTVLAELFAFFVERDVHIISETHSEHLLLTVRRLVAEKRLASDSVAIYYVERKERDSAVSCVAMEEDGHITATAWPAGFFADGLRESLALAAAQDDK